LIDTKQIKRDLKRALFLQRRQLKRTKLEKIRAKKQYARANKIIKSIERRQKILKIKQKKRRR